ncbi:hypothetical protein E2562_003805 [Oryza meyeriana var. granulata]|uniref:SCP domain-containing protein n=1 Tax=Oryza meyeriana var. granulata TaxID=110450 RepID=A0A6G1BRJ3_9ORYZ|nr:hypothetical protein E2562_003805 [Oryza meyeriana var. granulata]
MSSSISFLAVLSLLGLATHLPDASATAAKFLTAVNDVRRQAGVPPLEWSAAVAQRAKQHAGWLRSSGRCDLAQIDKDPSDNTGGALTYFLNGGTGRVAPADVVGAWAGERRWYDAGAKACVAGKQCGDYMIMVRPASKQLGCAVAVCASGKTIMVCEYYSGH